MSRQHALKISANKSGKIKRPEVITSSAEDSNTKK